MIREVTVKNKVYYKKNHNTQQDLALLGTFIRIILMLNMVLSIQSFPIFFQMINVNGTVHVSG